MPRSPARAERLEARRLLFGGDLDPSFSSDGIEDVGSVFGTALAVQSDGSPLVGFVEAVNPTVMNVRRRTPTGANDSTFGASGKASVSFADLAGSGAQAKLMDMAVAPDGKIVVAGFAEYATITTKYGLVARFNADGTIDTGFGDNGRVLVDGIDVDVGSTAFYAVAIQTNSRIVLSGWGEIDQGIAPSAALFARLNVNGTFDNSFGGNGQLKSEIDAIPTALSLAANGQILFGGTSYVGTTNLETQFTYGRINSDGTFDGNFSDDGVHTTPFITAYSYNGLGDIKALPDNKVLIVGSVGHADTATRNVGVLRLNVNGTRDTTFGANNGRAEFEFGAAGVTDGGSEIELSATGKYLIGGTSAGQMKVALLNADGTRDLVFASDGTLDIPTVSGGLSEMSAAAGGKFIAMGPGANTRLARFFDRRHLNVGMFTFNSEMNEAGQTSVSVVVTRDQALPTATNVYLNLTGTAVYPIDGVINQPIDYTTAGINMPGEFVATPYVTIPANQDSAFFTFTAVNDTRVEGTETAIVTLADVGTYDAFNPRSLTLTIADNDFSPTVTNRQFLFETSPQRVQFTFDQDVGASVTASDFTITGPGTVPVHTLAYNPTTRIATLTFAGNVLPDGNYTVTLPANRVTNAQGNPNIVANALTFHVLAGDANRDRVVNFDDLVILAQNYGLSGKTFSQGNFNYSPNGSVDFDDLVILAQRYNASVAVVAPILATTKRKEPRVPIV